MSNDLHVLIAYLNFRADNFSHDGLGVNGAHAVRLLRKNGIFAECCCVKTRAEIEQQLDMRHGSGTTVTHCCIEAPWLPATEMVKLMRKYRRTEFVCRLHAQVSFLQVDGGAFEKLEGYKMLQDGDVGFTLASNNQRFCRHFESVHNCYCTYLPNLYDLDRPSRKRPVPHTDRLLRIASFGALRPMKNHLTAAAAAMEIARRRSGDLEFWVSTGRDEEHGVLRGIRNLFAAHPWAKAVGNPWQPWAQFRHTIARMDLVIQASYTESFNIVTADAVSEGVPCVVSPAIEWMPDFCQADPDDASAIARTGSMLLADPHVCWECFDALEAYVGMAVTRWKKFLGA